jgi:hypothetical protein
MWWAHVDLNHGPRPYQGRALTELSYGPDRDRGVYRDCSNTARATVWRLRRQQRYAGKVDD